MFTHFGALYFEPSCVPYYLLQSITAGFYCAAPAMLQHCLISHMCQSQPAGPLILLTCDLHVLALGWATCTVGAILSGGDSSYHLYHWLITSWQCDYLLHPCFSVLFLSVIRMVCLPCVWVSLSAFVQYGLEPVWWTAHTSFHRLLNPFMCA